MDAELKKTLKAVTLELRHLLEGRYDSAGKWKPGDLEQRLAAIGVRRDRASAPVDELRHLAPEDRQARKVVDAYVKLRQEAGVERSDAVAEFVRETAYTWANRLLALRCMEARELIDSVILQQEAYGGRSLEHHRLAQRHPELCAGDDDGLFAVLEKVFREQAARLPMLFDLQAPGIALRPAPAALKDCFGLLSLDPETLRKYRIRLKEDETASAGAEVPNPFTAPDALGWAYQYWNTEEKERVFEKVRTVKGAKIAGADIVPATQLYTEDYMVKFLVQNSLGATWMGMHPESKLSENWEYYVKDADRAPVSRKAVREITFLDPACGSGHFLLDAFDVFYAMYQEEGELTRPEAICDAILTKNLFGIDIDARAVQIAEVALWMKATERAFDYKGVPTNLVAATASHLKGEAWEQFLSSFQREPSVARVLRKFAQSMEHIDEIGSLARPAEDLHEIIREEHATWERQVRERKEANFLFPEMRDEALSGRLPFQETSDEEFGERLFYRARASIDAFTEQARSSGDFEDQMLGSETRAGFRLVDLLSRRYDVVAANPPYMGSKNMGPELRAFVQTYYEKADNDLYSTFVKKCLLLCRPDARLGLVIPETWMLLGSYSAFRFDPSTSKNGLTTGFLIETSVETLAQLGRHAFSEGDPPSNVTLVCAGNRAPGATHRPLCYRLNDKLQDQGYDSLLLAAVRARSNERRFRPVQSELLRIPRAPFSYWVADDVLRVLASSRRISEVASVHDGMTTSNNERFLRFTWEVDVSASMWRRYAKAGRYCRWYGLERYRVRWDRNGALIKAQPKSYVRNERRYFTDGLTYNLMARGAIGARTLRNAAFDPTSVSIFPSEPKDSPFLLGLVNTHTVSYLLRFLAEGSKFNGGYVATCPLPQGAPATIASIADGSVALKHRVESRNLLEECFDPVKASMGQPRYSTAAMKDACLLLVLEGLLESLALRAYGLDAAKDAVISDTGTPAGWYPRVEDNDATRISTGHQEDATRLLDEALKSATQKRISSDEVRDIRCRLREFFENGPGMDYQVDESPEGGANGQDGELETVPVVVARLPIPSESFLDELCQRMRIHPFSVFLLLSAVYTRVAHRPAC